MSKLKYFIPVILFSFCLLFFNSIVFANEEDDFTYEDSHPNVRPYYPGGVTLTGDLNSNRKDLVIPDTLGGKPITTIGINAFRNKQLTSVTMSNNVKTIAYGAFQNNQLTSITLSNQLEFIGINALNNNNLSRITIPSSVKGIWENALIGNDDLKTITILGSDTELEQNSIPRNTKIIAVNPSKAQEYANDNGFAFEEIANKITYDGNGQTSGEVSEDYTGKSTSTFFVENQGSLKKTGYTFTGWNSNQDGSGTDYNVGEEKLINQDLTLYAKWERNQYTVSYKTDGGTTVAPETVTDNEKATAPASPTKVGHTFAGWYKEEAFITEWNFATDVVTEATTLYAKWTVNSYTVTFETSGGTAVVPLTIMHNEKVTIPIIPTKAGHTFAGWYKGIALTTEWNFATDVVTENITLYAKWERNQYTVSYKTDGGTTVAPETVTDNEKATAPASPTKVGHTFAGWYKEAAFITEWNFATDVVTEATTLYAKWTVNSYTVTFETSGGTAVVPLTIMHNEKVTIPIIPTKAGHTFAGWYKDIALTTEWNFATDVVTENITLYAKWIVNSPTVGGGQSPEPPSQVETPSPAPEPTNPVVPPNIVPTPTEPSVPEPQEFVFSDMSKTHWAWEMMQEMVVRGVITGYADGTFKPNEPVTRQHVAVMLARALELAPKRRAISFSDISPSHPYYEAIMLLQQAGIVDGSNGAFKPNEPMTRAQMAKIIVLAFGLTPGGTSTFQDVSSTHWSYDYIAALADAGIAVGDNGDFKPEVPVTRAQLVAFLYRALNQ